MNDLLQYAVWACPPERQLLVFPQDVVDRINALTPEDIEDITREMKEHFRVHGFGRSPYLTAQEQVDFDRRMIRVERRE